MKILLIGNSIKGGLADSFFKAFLGLEETVEILDDLKLYQESASFAKNKYCHRLFWRILASPLQKRIIEKVIAEKPDLILVFKGWLIKPKTLLRIKKTLPQAKLFNFNPDNPFNTWHHGNSNNWIRKSIPFYDAYFIWGEFLIKPLERAGAKKAVYLPFGYDGGLHYPVKTISEERKIYGSDIAFIGSWDKERENWLNYLLDYNLKIWGNSWEKADKKLMEKWQKKAAIGEEFSKICDSSKIIVNIVRKQNIPAHNMRTFEIPACGGFTLATRTEEQDSFFNEGAEAEYFSTPEELRRKIDFYLKNEGLRKKIAQASRKKLIKSNYSYKDRAKKIFEIYYDGRGTY